MILLMVMKVIIMILWCFDIGNDCEKDDFYDVGVVF